MEATDNPPEPAATEATDAPATPEPVRETKPAEDETKTPAAETASAKQEPEPAPLAVGARCQYVCTGKELTEFSPRAGELRPATVVRVWPNEFGRAPGYNVLVDLDGANDLRHVPPDAPVRACIFGAQLWVTSIKATTSPTPGSLLVGLQA